MGSESNKSRELKQKIADIQRKIELNANAWKSAQKDLEEARSRMNASNSLGAGMKETLRGLQQRAALLAKADTGVVQVSDHAVLRYLERVGGYDIEAIRKDMVTPQIATAIGAGAKKVHLSDGSTYIIGDDGVVVTVIAGKEDV